jgi:CubicO group peptidase (beta-lactamase class C family)
MRKAAMNMIEHTRREYWPTKGWRESSPEDQGMDSALLSDLDTYVKETRPYLNTLLIVRHGHIVFERYYKDYNQSSYQLLNSATKSVVSALVGIALQEGYLKSLDQTWKELLPEYFLSETSLQKQHITIRHLLKMTSGLHPDFLAYPGRFGDTSEDWVRYAAEKPILAQPEQLFLYCSIGSHLLSVILTRVTGMSTVEFARRYLFTPLGIDTDEQAGFFWKTDPQGYMIGGTWLHLKARDAAKFGYLYASHGRWGDVQIIPSEYIQESTREHTKGGHPEGTGYGYHWWVEEVAGHHSFYAAGYGGQYIHVFPDLDLVIVMFVLPAIKEEKSGKALL